MAEPALAELVAVIELVLVTELALVIELMLMVELVLVIELWVELVPTDQFSFFLEGLRCKLFSDVSLLSFLFSVVTNSTHSIHVSHNQRSPMKLLLFLSSQK